jgi:hypothetical protein
MGLHQSSPPGVLRCALAPCSTLFEEAAIDHRRVRTRETGRDSSARGALDRAARSLRALRAVPRIESSPHAAFRASSAMPSCGRQRVSRAGFGRRRLPAKAHDPWRSPLNGGRTAHQTAGVAARQAVCGQVTKAGGWRMVVLGRSWRPRMRHQAGTWR